MKTQPHLGNLPSSTKHLIMSSAEILKFSDLNGPVESNNHESVKYKRWRKKPGCYISVLSGFILTFLAIMVAVVVGLIVHFASPGRHFECTCNCKADHNGIQTYLGQDQKRMCEQYATTSGECLTLPSHCTDITSFTDDPTTEKFHISSRPPRPTDVRLPPALTPINYKVELRAHIYSTNSSTFTFDGHVDIKLKCHNDTNSIYLHIFRLEIDNDTIAIKQVGGKDIRWSHWQHDKARQFFKIFLGEDIKKGEEYIVSMGFTGPLRPDLTGLYVSSYQQDKETKYLATTQMQPTDARKVFPCMDEPALKATFDITLVRKPHLTTLANMPKLRQETRAGGWVADVYDTTVEMSTYLLAFVFCEFRYKEKKTKYNTEFRVWARPDAIDQVDYALDVGVKILEYFENYFDVPFPLPKSDMIAVPDFGAGAMENWGLIIYRETALLFDPKVSNAFNKQQVAVVVSHELAHQWFGNLVTPTWWDDLWLNEGFASYVEYLGVDFVHPSWKMKEQFIVDDLHSVFQVDGLGSSHPIYVPVNNPEEINEIFDRISYAKGASVIRMMNNFLGEDTFRKGLTNYLKEHQYSDAHHTDLWRALNTQAQADGQDINVEEIMNTWVLQMGYPVINMNRSSTYRNKIHVAQEHFLLDPRNPPDPKYPTDYNYKWIVPLTYTTYPNIEFQDPEITWMKFNDIDVEIDSSSDWYIANLNQFGYYRVNYDEHNWNQIFHQLKTDHAAIPVINRAQIIDDTFQLGRAGLLDQLLGLRATEYFDVEKEFIPWSAAGASFKHIKTMFMHSQFNGVFKKYMLRQSLPLYKEFGWTPGENTPHLEKYHRTNILSYACWADYHPCMTSAVGRFEMWMNNSNNVIIDPMLKSLVYCYGVKMGDVEEWDFVYHEFRTANVANEKMRLMYALSCTTEPWLLKRFMVWALDPNIVRPQDAFYVMTYVAKNPIGRTLVWDFVRSHWPEVKACFTGGLAQLGNLFSGITTSFNTDFELHQLYQFQEKNGVDLVTIERTFQQVIEKTKANIKWMNDNEERIGNWLQETLKS